MNTFINETLSNLSAKYFTERRYGEDRRIIVDQRIIIRFDGKGGERRQDSGRRSSDDIFEVMIEEIND